MTNDQPPADLISALTRYRDRQFAILIGVALELAVEEHPELIRAALGKVFSLAAFAETEKKLGERITTSLVTVTNLEARIRTLTEDVVRLEARIARPQTVPLRPTNGHTLPRIAGATTR